MGQKGSGLKNIKYLRQFSHISSRITLSLTQICLNPVRLTKNDRKKEKKIIKRKRCYKLIIASFIFLNTLPNLSWITISAL